MPIRMLNFLQAPPPVSRHGAGSAMFKSEEWQDFVMALGAGLKPQEYISVEFGPDHPLRAHLKSPVNSFIHCAKTKIKELRLPYDVYERAGVIYVVGRGVIS